MLVPAMGFEWRRLVWDGVIGRRGRPFALFDEGKIRRKQEHRQAGRLDQLKGRSTTWRAMWC